MHRVCPESVLQGRHPTGGKGGRPHSNEDEMSCAYWMLYLFCLQAASVIFPHMVKMFADITSNPWKMPLTEHENYKLRWLEVFRTLLCIFYPVYIDIFPEHYSLSNISFYTTIPQPVFLEQVSQAGLRPLRLVPTPPALSSPHVLSPITW